MVPSGVVILSGVWCAAPNVVEGPASLSPEEWRLPVLKQTVRQSRQALVEFLQKREVQLSRLHLRNSKRRFLFSKNMLDARCLSGSKDRCVIDEHLAQISARRPSIAHQV